MRAYLLTIENQVVQFLPGISISEHFESIYLTILQQILFLLLWSGGHRCMEQILCRVAESSYLPIHNIVPHTSLHDQSCHKTMKKHEDFDGRVGGFSATCFCNCPHHLCLFRIVFSLLSSCHIGSRFCFFPANFVSHTQIRKNPFPRWTKRHSQFGIFSRPCFNKIISNCLSHDSPAKRWPYKFLSRGTTGPSILDHDFGHLCRGRRIQMSGHNLWASSIFAWA